MSFTWILAIAAASSWLGTGAYRRYAVKRSILDIPNVRSSHTVPTPRGGGLSIVVTFLAGVLALAYAGTVGAATSAALIGAGLVVALVGFVDDRRHVAARWRLLAHFCGAVWVVACLGGLPPLRFVGTTVDLGWSGCLLAVVGLVWLLNLFNFMDGIDGIAGVEVLTACLGSVLLYPLHPVADAERMLPALLATATTGFLIWNFPPARIFLGDAGSGFLGLVLGVLALRVASLDPDLFWCWLILLGVFIVDATLTLVQRLRRGARLSEAHRGHAYQRAAVRLGGHLPVTLAVGAINLLWLLPWAYLVESGNVSGVLGLLCAYAPLGLIAWRLGAGTSES